MAKFDHFRTNSNIAFVTNFVSEESSNLPARTLVGMRICIFPEVQIAILASGESSNLPARTLVGVRRREKKLFFFGQRGKNTGEDG